MSDHNQRTWESLVLMAGYGRANGKKSIIAELEPIISANQELSELRAQLTRLRAIVQRAREDLGPHPRCTDCGAYQHELRELYLAADKALNPTGATQCETESS